MLNQCKNGHTDEVFDGYCDNCGADLVLDNMEYPSTPSAISSFFGMIKSLFEKITEFFRNLLNP